MDASPCTPIDTELMNSPNSLHANVADNCDIRGIAKGFKIDMISLEQVPAHQRIDTTQPSYISNMDQSSNAYLAKARL